MSDVCQLPVSEQMLRNAIHELIGFLAGSALPDADKKLAMNLPSVQLVCVPTYSVPCDLTLIKIKVDE